MKEIIAFFIVSGGVGFFNLYIAQETDFLYFGKYNKEERIAWLSIFTFTNYFLVTDYMRIVNKNHGLFILITTGIEAVIISTLASFVLPKIINWLIDSVRRLFGKPGRSYLPPVNSFFEDIDNYYLYSFDFNGTMISSGKIKQSTEERQNDLTVLITPTTPGENVSYPDFLEVTTEAAQKGELIMSEFTDYSNKVHLIKIKEMYTE